MPEFVLRAEPRADQGTAAARRLRRAGHLPAVLYGHKEAAQSLVLATEEVEATIRAGARMVDLLLGDQTQSALIKEVQYDPLGDHLLHVDFVRIAMDETVEVTVPVEVQGTSPGVREGGVLEVLLHEITVECLPGNMPEVLRVRVDALPIGGLIHVADLVLPEGVKALDEPDTVVVAVHAPAAEAEPVPAEEAPAAPEVIGRKEEPEEGQEEADRE